MRNYKLTNDAGYVSISDSDWIARISVDNPEYIAWLAEGNTPLPADVPLLTELKAAKVIYINQKASEELSAITSSYPKDEIATWPSQLWDALAWQKNPLDNLVILPQIAANAGITVGELAVRVLTLAAQFNNVSGAIIGKRKALTKQVELALTNEALELIVW